MIKRLLFVFNQLNLIDKYHENVFIGLNQRFTNVDFGNVIKIDRYKSLLKLFRIRIWNLSSITLWVKNKSAKKKSVKIMGR